MTAPARHQSYIGSTSDWRPVTRQLCRRCDNSTSITRALLTRRAVSLSINLTISQNDKYGRYTTLNNHQVKHTPTHTIIHRYVQGGIDTCSEYMEQLGAWRNIWDWVNNRHVDVWILCFRRWPKKFVRHRGIKNYYYYRYNNCEFRKLLYIHLTWDFSYKMQNHPKNA